LLGNRLQNVYVTVPEVACTGSPISPLREAHHGLDLCEGMQLVLGKDVRIVAKLSILSQLGH